MKSPGGGFHIDRRIWRLHCDRENINKAVSYLTIATGTGADNLWSIWSAQSIEKYLGLHNLRATESITQLIAEGLVRRAEGSTRTRPVYEIQPYAAVVEALQRAKGEPSLIALSSIRRGCKLAKRSLPIADRLVAAGLIFRDGPHFSLEPPPAETAGELIWLPNTLITGTHDGEASPVRRLRSCGDMRALRLLIDLYQAQNLSADGGISRKVLRQNYKRQKLGESGRRTIWGFKRESLSAASHSSTQAFWRRKSDEDLEKNPIFEALSTLIDVGLLVIVPHLVENAALDCEPLHGFGWDDAGEGAEQELGTAADEAARYMLGEKLLFTVERNEIEMLAPAWNTLPDVQMVGVYRLTYRPQTKMTADWLRRMNDKSAEWLEEYKRLAPQVYAFSQVS